MNVLVMTRQERLIRWLLVLAVATVGGLFSLNLSINDDALDLLPDGAVRGDLQLLGEIGLVNRLFISLSVDENSYASAAEAKLALRKSAAGLGDALTGSAHFTNVLAKFPTGYEGGLFSLFWPALPLLLDREDLDRIDGLTSTEGLQKMMYENFVLLNSPAGIGVKNQVQRDPLGLIRILFAKLAYLQAEFTVRPDEGFLQSGDGRGILVLAESRLPLTDLKNSEIIQAELEQAYGRVLQPGIHVDVIGTLPHTLANSRAIKRDLRVLLPIATVMLILLLAVTLRDRRAGVVFGVPFLGALPAIGLTSCVFGEISALALGFGIVILGISVDFSVHLFLALVKDGGQRQDVLRSVRRPIIFAFLTTASVLLVLFFSDVPSHRQMAMLALAGVLFGVVFAWLLIPTIIPEKNCETDVQQPLIAVPCLQHLSVRTAVIVLWLLLILCGLWSWQYLQYNGDLRVLDAPDRDVEAAEDRFRESWGGGGEQAFVVTSGTNLDEALERGGELFQFLLEQGFATIQTPVALLPGLSTQRTRIDNWRAFWEAEQPEFHALFTAAAMEQGFSGQAFQPFFTWLKTQPEILTRKQFDGTAFEPMLDSMIRLVEASGEKSAESLYLVLTTVGVDEERLPLLLDYGEHNLGVTVLANRKWREEVEHLLKKDILLLSALAGCAVVFLVAVQFRQVTAVAAVLAPVVSALAAMSVFCRATGSELNMMHLIMGIMVIGLSVDYGIFIVCSSLERTAASAPLAVSICAASSLIGFGVLSFADHPALYSLGITVLVGIGTAWPVALFVSPVILAGRGKAEV